MLPSAVRLLTDTFQEQKNTINTTIMFERWMERAIYCSREIDAAPAVVWSVIRDVGSYDQVLSGVTRVERLDDHQQRRDCADCDQDDRPSVAAAADDSGEAAATTEDDDNAPRRRRRRRASVQQQVPKDDVIHVGMRFRIHRVNEDGARYFGDWDVTHVENNFARNDDYDEDENTASVNAKSASSRSGKPEYSVTFFTANVLGGILCSSTWSVRRSPDGDDHRTIASIGIAFLPRRLFYMAGIRILWSCFLRRRAVELTEIDLNDIAAAAETIAKQDAAIQQQRPPS